jgi:folate-dependent tRNA-U54 methylase TrmFO/GidA
MENEAVDNISILGGGFTGTELAYSIANKGISKQFCSFDL